jgi:DHA1 family inner membrane transport protein
VRDDSSAATIPAAPVGLLLGTLTLGAFLTTTSGAARSPFLLDMANDLGTDLTAVANLMAIMAVTWGMASLVAGTASDRLGRKVILTGAIVAVGLAMGGMGLAQTYPQAVFWGLAGGIGGGSFMGTVFATVSDHVAPAERGKSLGWVMTGQSLSLVLGVPMSTLIGSQIGWRGAHLTFAAITVLVGLTMLLLVPRRGAYQATARESAAAAPLKTIMTPRILTLLASGTAERVCFAAMSVYLATFLITAYNVPLGSLAVALLLIMLGNFVGAQIADKVPSREALYGASLIATGLVALPLLLWTPSLYVSVGLGFVYTLANALGRPAYMSVVSAVPEAVRGTVLGLNVTFASFGWIAASAVGGWLIAGSGFGSLGMFCAGAAVFGTIMLLIGRALAGRAVAAGRPDESTVAPVSG